MVADTEVRFHRHPLASFRQWVDRMPFASQSLLQDLAAGYGQQTQLTISRWAQDAQARCAQWLLHHAQRDDGGDLRVTLRDVLHNPREDVIVRIGMGRKASFCS